MAQAIKIPTDSYRTSMLSSIAIASLLCLHAPAMAASLDVGDCQTNLFQQGYLNGINDNCPPDFSETRSDFTMALQGAGHPCEQILNGSAGFHFNQGEERFYQDQKRLGLESVCRIAKENIRIALRVINKSNLR